MQGMPDKAYVHGKQELPENSPLPYLAGLSGTDRRRPALTAWKTTYKLRSQTIERVFANAKEKYGMRFRHTER